MIEGLHFDVKGTELKSHLQKRAHHHVERSIWYGEQAKNLADDSIREDGSFKFSNSNSNPVENLKSSAKKHRYLGSKFTFMAEHLVVEDTYRLSETELTTLELIESMY